MASGTIWKHATVLITGATGTFGQAMVRHCLSDLGVRAVRLYSRDELKQADFAATLTPQERDHCRFLLGDVRDRARLTRAMEGANLVVHAAALKRVDAAAYDPIESVKTNVLGAINVIDAAIDAGVQRIVGLSTDKGASPSNLYGATKLILEHLFAYAHHYAGRRSTRFGCVRYGNVLGSRGSVLPLWLAQHARGEPLTITDARMTRFWITLPQAVQFVAQAVQDLRGRGGETFIPLLPRSRVVTMAQAVAPEGWPLCTTTLRPGGEKLHETLLSEDECRVAQWAPFGERYVVRHGTPTLPDPRCSPLRSCDAPLLDVEGCRALLREAGLLPAGAETAGQPGVPEGQEGKEGGDGTVRRAVLAPVSSR